MEDLLVGLFDCAGVEVGQTAVNSLSEGVFVKKATNSVVKQVEVQILQAQLYEERSKFSRKLSDINKFLSCVNAGHLFRNTTNETHVARYINGVKNKLDSASFDAFSAAKFDTLKELTSAIENLFLTYNDPSPVQV